jgi:PAS domain S-box-containing protein
MLPRPADEESTRARLRESERRYREVFENVSDALCLVDVCEGGKFRLLEMNGALERATGVPRDQKLGRWLHEAVPEPVRDEMLAMYRRCAETAARVDGELTLNLPDGPRCYEVTIVPVPGDDGAVARLVGVKRDVTLRKQHEAVLRQRLELETRLKGVARELHDELGQVLTSVRMGAALLRVRFGAGNAPLVDSVAELTDMIDRAIGAVRGAASALRPAALDLGIASALAGLVRDFERHSGVACSLETDGLDLDEAAANDVFRIVQESLTNVARHAQARHVHVELRRDESDALLQVRDDGRGFDVAAARGKLGLLGMRERALALGGELALDSAPGRGMRVLVRFPLRDA